MATEFPIKANVKGAVQDLTALENAIRKAGGEAKLAEKEIDDIVKATRKAKTEGGTNINSLNKSIGTINGSLKEGTTLLAGFFAVDRIKAFIGEVVKTTSEFGKLNALLENTLGSKGAAIQAFSNLQKQAKLTNFSLLEVTNGFLKLANNGVKPTNEELTAFFDLTNNAGKSFDQFVEAINDATRGEFERLKEFFISASKQGDRIIFTFKGQTFEAERNAESIKNVLVQLGNLNGVQGATAKIAEQLEGRISNLGDGWDKFMGQLGKSNEGVLFKTVGLLDSLVEGLQAFTAEGRGELRGFSTDFLSQFLDQSIIDQATDLTFKPHLRRLSGETQSFLSDTQKFFFQLIDNIDVKSENLVDLREKIANEIELIAETNKLKFKEEGEAVRIATKFINQLVQQANRETDEAVAKRKKTLKEIADEARQQQLEQEEKRVQKLREAYEKLDDITSKFNSDLAIEQSGEEFKRAKKAVEELQASFGFNPQKLSGELEAPEAEEGLSDNELADIQARVDARKQAEEEVRDFTLDAIGEVLRSREIAAQRELAILDSRFSHELALAGNNENKKADIARRFEAERVKLLNKQAQQQQLSALFNIAVNQGPAIAKTAAHLPFPLAIPFIAAVVALFGLQLANQRKIQAPKFAAKGEFDIKGPGNETSDSIPYMLSVGESVAPASKTKRFAWLLKPLIEDKNFDSTDLRNLIDRRLPNDYSPVILKGAGASNESLIEEMRLTRKAIEQKKETHLSFDEEGINIWQGREREWVLKRNKKLSL